MNWRVRPHENSPDPTFYCMNEKFKSGPFIRGGILPQMAQSAHEAGPSHSLNAAPAAGKVLPNNNWRNSSMVITRSGHSSETYGLSGIVLKDEMCLGLPPNVTWEELSKEKLHDTYYLKYLLDCTRRINREMKRCGKEVQIAGRMPREKPTSIAPARKPTAAVQEIIQSEKTEPLKEVKKPAAIISEKESNESCGEKRRFSVTELLEFKNKSPTNLNVVDCVRRIGCYRSATPKSPLKSPPKLASRIRAASSSNDDETNANGTLNQNKLKNLLKESWLNDDLDDTNGKEIFYNLNNSIKEEFPAGLSEMIEKCEKLSVEADSIGGKTVKFKLEDENSGEKKNKTSSLVPVEQYYIGRCKKRKLKKAAIEAAEESTITANKTETDDLPFDDYYDEQQIEEGLKNGALYKEIIRINSKNTKEAFISSDGKDIFIDGTKDRNRALEGDEVVVELHPEIKWKRSANETIQKCGKVVAITEKNHPRTAVGYLKMVYGKSYGIIIWPRDSRIPRIRVKEKTCPHDFRTNYKRYNNTLFLAAIKTWNSVKSAEGVVLQKLGEDDSIVAESERILLENNLDMKCLEDSEQHLSDISDSIPEDVIMKREDIRQQCVFTVDPPSAKDLDDALSYRLLPNGKHEVGVHIADVSHYLKAGTPLDEDARKKANSVYLVDKVFHMLPTKLCQICSLLPDADKLAFSVFMEMDDEANIENYRFSKTVLRSCAQLNYSHAQEVIDQRNADIDIESFPPISNGYTVQTCANIILQLYLLSSKMRKRRFADGALRIDQPKLLFQLDEQKQPVAYSLEKGRECNWLIEEFMLAANNLTANKIVDSFPETSLLRLHAPPKEESLMKVVEFLEKVGIFIESNSAGDIFKSMMRYDLRDESGSARMTVIMNLLVKPMPKASYVCSSKQSASSRAFWHYALNTPYYTHFTSPIRRYADIVVHRLLASCIGVSEAPTWDKEYIRRTAAICNAKKVASKRASEMSIEFHLRLYLEKFGPMKSRAVVIEVKEKFFDVIDLSTRILGRVYVDKIKNTEHVDYSDGNGIPSLTVMWKPDGATKTLIQVFRIVDVELSRKKNTDKYLNNNPNVTLIYPPDKA